MKLKPETKLGKWSVGLNTLFLIVIAISIFLVNVFDMLSYDDHWWDVTVPVIFTASIFLSRKNFKEIFSTKDF